MGEALILSAAMEGYLEVILELSENEGTVRVTDIAAKLNIAKASVTEAISNLVRLKLANQEKYGPVTLTKKGREHAEKIRCRHRILKSFLIEVLGVEPKIAEKDACLMEHVVSPVTMKRLVDFLEESGKLEGVREECRKGGGTVNQVNITALNKLPVGSRGKVIRIAAKGSLRRRILDMGIVPGAEIIVKGRAPLGDPIEIAVKGYNLTLRNQEASNVFVEAI